MKVKALETIRLAEFANILWLRVETDDGLVGLGETFFGARAVEAYIHESVATSEGLYQFSSASISRYRSSGSKPRVYERTRRTNTSRAEPANRTWFTHGKSTLSMAAHVAEHKRILSGRPVFKASMETLESIYSES